MATQLNQATAFQPPSAFNPQTGRPNGSSTDDIGKNELLGNETLNNNVSNWAANTVQNGVNNSPAANMFNPNVNAQAEGAYGSGLQGAQTQQQGLANEANQYDQFAGGVQSSLQPSIDKQQNAADQQQAQASWMWNNPGYTDQEKQAMQTSAGTPIAGAYTAAQGQLKNNTAITGNSAGLASGEAQLARQKAQDMAASNLNLQGQFANQCIQGQQNANQAMGGAASSQGNVSSSRQGAANTTANTLQGGANIRMGAAGSNLQTSGVGNSGMGTQQNAAALSLAPAQLASGMYGTAQGSIGNNTGQQTNLDTTGMNNSLGTQVNKGVGNLVGNIGKG